jgi:hypothetical protein
MRLGVSLLRHQSRLTRTSLAGVAERPAAWLRTSLRRETARLDPDRSGWLAPSGPGWRDTAHAAVAVALVALVLLAVLVLSVLEVSLSIPLARPAVTPDLEPAACDGADPGLPTRSERNGVPARIGPEFTC